MEGIKGPDQRGGQADNKSSPHETRHKREAAEPGGAVGDFNLTVLIQSSLHINEQNVF